MRATTGGATLTGQAPVEGQEAPAAADAMVREQVQDEAERFLQDRLALVPAHIVTIAVRTDYSA
jgi:hypothetical protein